MDRLKPVSPEKALHQLQGLLLALAGARRAAFWIRQSTVEIASKLCRDSLSHWSWIWRQPQAYVRLRRASRCITWSRRLACNHRFRTRLESLPALAKLNDAQRHAVVNLDDRVRRNTQRSTEGPKIAPGITRDNSGIRGMPTLASGLRISSQLGPVETIPQTHRGPHGLFNEQECEAGYRGHEWGSIKHSPYVRLPTCETGSLETAPSATQSPRCSHSGIARGQLRVFLRVSGDCSGSREGAEEDEARPRQSGGQCAEDRLANRVSWSGFRGIRRQRRTTVRAAQPRAVDRKSLRLRESASQVSRSYPVLSRV